MIENKTIIKEQEQSYNKKVIIIAAISIFIIIGFLIYITTLKWITVIALLFIISLLVIGGGIPFFVVYLKKGLDKKQKESLFEQKLKVDSSNIIEWAKKHMREKYGTEIDVKSDQILQFGKFGERTPICYVEAFGRTTYQQYHILVNLFEPTIKNSLIRGIVSWTEILRVAENLSYSPYYRPKRIVKHTSPEGSQTETEEDITPPDVDEETEVMKNE